MVSYDITININLIFEHLTYSISAITYQWILLIKLCKLILLALPILTVLKTGGHNYTWILFGTTDSD